MTIVETSVFMNPLTAHNDQHILNLGVNQNRLYLYGPRETGVYSFLSAGSSRSKSLYWGSVPPAQYAEGQDVHHNGDGVDNADEDQLVLHGLHFQHDVYEREPVEISEEEDKPDARKGEVPPGVLPHEQVSDVQHHLDEDGQDGEEDGEEPAVGQAQQFSFPVRKKRMIVDEAEEGEGEDYLDVPPHEDPEGGGTGGGPYRRAPR